MADDPHPPDAWRPTRRGSTTIGLVALGALAALVTSLQHTVALDDWVWRHVLLMRGCATDGLVDRIVDDLTRGLIVLMAVVVIVHARQHGWRSAWPWVSACGLGLVAGKALKHVLTRDRPSSLPDVAIGYSFPSAHAMNSMAALLAILALAYGFRRRNLWWIAATVPTAMVAAGRIVLGRHWFCDVMGGALAAVALIGLVVPAVARRPVVAPVLLALVLSVTLLVDHRLGDAGLRLPTPMIGARAASIVVDVGRNDGTALDGTWREPGEEHPGGPHRWLQDQGTIALQVSDVLAADLAREADGLRLAFGGRTANPRPGCMTVTVELNRRVVGRFVPFEGWREYRLPIPRGLLHAGRNDVALAVTAANGPARLALSYLRIGRSSTE
ncbi:MAG: phosphatase PAP2 family protein [Candidatus Binatia bacterium]